MTSIIQVNSSRFYFWYLKVGRNEQESMLISFDYDSSAFLCIVTMCTVDYIISIH